MAIQAHPVVVLPEAPARMLGHEAEQDTCITVFQDADDLTFREPGLSHGHSV
jgi:hypothetical protein